MHLWRPGVGLDMGVNTLWISPSLNPKMSVVVVVEIVVVVLIPSVSYLTLYNPMDCSPEAPHPWNSLGEILGGVPFRFSRQSS